MVKIPVLVYPDPNKPYILFTYASKYIWYVVLTQEYTTSFDGKMVSHQRPFTYATGLFQGSWLKWAAVTKEAYTMSVTKLSFYLADASFMLRTDHLPLRKFLQKTTLNAKVNSWGVDYNIKFKFIKGVKTYLWKPCCTLLTLILLTLTHMIKKVMNMDMLCWSHWKTYTLIVMNVLQCLQ